MKIIILPCLLFAFFSAFSQGGRDPRKDIQIAAGSLFYAVDGKPVTTADHFKVVEGSYFFNENWMNAILVFNNGNEQKNINARLDLLKNNVHYQDQFGNEFIANPNIKEIIFIDTLADVNYRFIHAPAISGERNNREQQWYQWLHSGKASLYKLFDKQVAEHKHYGSATTEIKIQTAESYLIYYNGTFFSVKKIKEIPSVLAIKKSDLDDFIKSDKLLNITSKDDKFVAVVQHFNFLMR